MPHLASKPILLSLAFAPTHADPHRALIVPLYETAWCQVRVLIERRDPLIGKSTTHFSLPASELPGYGAVQIIIPF